MKKYLCLIFAVLLAVLSGALAYKAGYSNGVKSAENFRELEDPPTGYVDKIDYPLIDIAFNDGNEWTVVITNGIYSENPTYRICKDARGLQFDKEYLSVLTYPAGRGTTGNGCVTVYKNGQEVKSVEYFEIAFANEEISNKFEKATREEVREFIAVKQETPLGSFTAEKTFSYDNEFYAAQSISKENGIDYITVSVYKANSDEEIYSFTPARAMDFWGICWEMDSYNLWIQSGDIGVLCYAYKNGEWNLDISAQKPEYIKSKYEK